MQSCTNVHVMIPHALRHPRAWFLPERRKYVMATVISAVVCVFYQATGAWPLLPSFFLK